jgi:hypothetical protein
MNKTIGLLALAVALSAGSSYAADNKQQSKMTECNA